VSLEFIDDLEKKIDEVVDSLQKTKEENKVQVGKIQELTDENGDLKAELEKLNSESSENKNMLNTAVDRIKNLLYKLENIEYN
jgi:FtsZ-binding cell division protein ZapB